MTIARCLTDSLSFLIHEFIGHGSVAAILSKPLEDYRLSFFSGAFLSFDHTGWSKADDILIYSAGWLSVILTTIVLIGMVRRLIQSNEISFYAILTALTMLLYTLFGMTISLYSGTGDGSVFYENLGDRRLVVVLPLLVCLALYSLCYARYIFCVLQCWIPGARVFLLLPILLVGIWFANEANSALHLLEIKYNNPHTLTDNRSPAFTKVEKNGKKSGNAYNDLPAKIILGDMVWFAYLIGPLLMRRIRPTNKMMQCAPSWRSVGFFAMALSSTWVLIGFLIWVRPFLFE